MYYTLLVSEIDVLNFTGGASVWNRRHFIAVCSSVGLSGTLLPGVLLTLAQGKPAITKEMIDAAAKIADVTIPDEYKQAMLARTEQCAQGYEAIYKLHMPNSVQPALVFDPLPMGEKFHTVQQCRCAIRWLRPWRSALQEY